MTELVFYSNPQSRARIVSWMLEELGVDYHTEWLDYGSSMKAPEYLRINPMGKVPAISHDGNVVTEAAAICAYLADAFPEKGLGPQSAAEKARYYRWLFFAAGPLEQAVVARTFGWEVPEGREGVAGFGSYGTTLDTLEKALQESTWICGERFTAADVYLGSAVNWGLMFGTIEKRPAFEAYAGRLIERPALQRSHQLNEERIKETAQA